MQRYDAQAVANLLLDLADSEKCAVTPMKLQKLVYFAHGWHLGITERPLLNERVEAWKFGPVIPSLYQDFKEFGDKPITSRATVISGFRVVRAVLPPETPATTLSIIQRVWHVYKGFSGTDLSAMTHQPGTPWDQTIKSLGGAIVKNADIDDNLIKQYFRALMTRN